MEKEVFGTVDEKEKRALEDIVDMFPNLAKIEKSNYVGYTLKLFIFNKRDMRSIAAVLRKRHKLSLRDLAERRERRKQQRTQWAVVPQRKTA